MKRFILTLAIITGLGAAGKLNAQMPYNVSVSKEEYKSLQGATRLNDTMWDDEVYKVAIPFPFKLNGKTITQFFIESGEIMLPDTAGTVDGLAIMSTDILDRGAAAINPASLSPISYIVEGAAGSRILKIEFSNAGFADEFYSNATCDDYFNLQVWLHEQGSVFEYRYGKSSVTDFSTYFPMGMLVGLAIDMNMSQGSFDKIYILSGSESAPDIDSFSLSSFANGIDTFPDSGRVYRFTPHGSGVGVGNDVAVQEIKVYPTQCSGALYIDNPGKQRATYKVLSLSGSILSSGALAQGRNTLDMGALPAGMYMIRFDYDAGFETKKFIKM